MRGFRTLIFAAIVAVAGIFGHHLAPEAVNSWLDAIFALVAVGIAVLRWITTTPIGMVMPTEARVVAGEIIAMADKVDPALADAADPPPPDASAKVDSASAATTVAPDLVAMATAISSTLKTVQTIHDQVSAQLASAHAAVTAAAIPVVAAPAPAQPLPAQPAPAQS